MLPCYTHMSVTYKTIPVRNSHWIYIWKHLYQTLWDFPIINSHTASWIVRLSYILWAIGAERVMQNINLIYRMKLGNSMKKRIKCQTWPVFANWVLNRALRECSTYWNAIKSARHFLKTPCCDLILTHFNLLYCGFCPIMVPSKEKAREKMLYQSDLSLYGPQQRSLKEAVIASWQHQCSQKPFALFAKCKL